ncbi:TetR/AcrR family transcriptional regulator [Massilia sp. 9096]|uniref:TetR/AcrR family transcriptional regulator n=1 Tax=Massilia sp. 9096 TaxID=1500894 RepID=UPI00068C107A|nr:TetR/AcrR family transcriptional regulator [Massilia sp. 9096]
MTDSPSPTALRGAAPKRQRGHDRVAAILQASTALFLDKGYEAVTMTEIAAASHTAIGSLYRFFPAKEAVADALLRQYTESLGAGLAHVRARVDALAHPLRAQALTDALVDFMSGLHAERGVALALVDARGLDDSRRALRGMMLDNLRELLGAVLTGASDAHLATMALAVLHVLKGVAQMPDGSAPAPALLDEYRRMLRAYLKASVETTAEPDVETMRCA